jgi:hypothetical protein
VVVLVEERQGRRLGRKTQEMEQTEEIYLPILLMQLVLLAALA